MDPDLDGSWESWTLLLDAEMIKPSGLPMGQNSPEDIDVWRAGHEFLLPVDIPYVRYIRLKIEETWGAQYRFMIDEMTFWGQEPSDILNDD